MYKIPPAIGLVDDVDVSDDKPMQQSADELGSQQKQILVDYDKCTGWNDVETTYTKAHDAKVCINVADELHSICSKHGFSTNPVLPSSSNSNNKIFHIFSFYEVTFNWLLLYHDSEINIGLIDDSKENGFFVGRDGNFLKKHAQSSWELECKFDDGFITEGDTIGCGLVVVQNRIQLETKRWIFFTKNDKIRGTPFALPSENVPETLFPTILFRKSSKISTNFGTEQFKYKIPLEACKNGFGNFFGLFGHNLPWDNLNYKAPVSKILLDYNKNAGWEDDSHFVVYTDNSVRHKIIPATVQSKHGFATSPVLPPSSNFNSHKIVHIFSFYEVTIKKYGSGESPPSNEWSESDFAGVTQLCSMRIGLAPENFPSDEWLGSSKNSYGVDKYGHVFQSGLRKAECFEGLFSKGDTVGCGLMVVQDGINQKMTRWIFFTKEDKIWGDPIPLLPDTPIPPMLYPTVSMYTSAEITANFGTKEFKYKIPPADGLADCYDALLERFADEEQRALQTGEQSSQLQTKGIAELYEGMVDDLKLVQ